ncbi:Olfactory receptor 13H1, partial [Galemys pyrenaicus]
MPVAAGCSAHSPEPEPEHSVETGASRLPSPHLAPRAEEMNYQEVGNHTEVTEFILVGLSQHPASQRLLFWALVLIYAATVAGNGAVVVLVAASPPLHTPMYFFLGNLSLLDVLFSSSAMPLMVANALCDFPTISYSSCFAQLAAQAFLALAECFLLAIMAYDRFVAISDPLRYNAVMSSRTCLSLAVLAWGAAFLLTVIPTLLLPVSFCGHNAVDHFSCEVQAIFKLLCSSTIFLEGLMLACAVASMPLPLLFIFASYLCILRAVLRIRASDARLKAFSTCSSHLLTWGHHLLRDTDIYLCETPGQRGPRRGQDCVDLLCGGDPNAKPAHLHPEKQGRDSRSQESDLQAQTVTPPRPGRAQGGGPAPGLLPPSCPASGREVDTGEDVQGTTGWKLSPNRHLMVSGWKSAADAACTLDGMWRKLCGGRRTCTGHGAQRVFLGPLPHSTKAGLSSSSEETARARPRALMRAEQTLTLSNSEQAQSGSGQASTNLGEATGGTARGKPHTTAESCRRNQATDTLSCAGLSAVRRLQGGEAA